MRSLPARRILGPSARLLLAAILAIGLAWLPIASVNACTCDRPSMPVMIERSDVAFTGTMAAVGGTERRGRWDMTAVAFDVDRAKAEMTTPVVIDVQSFGNGSACGLEMAVGEDWLIIAHVEGGPPQAGLCSGSAMLASLDQPTRDLVATAMVVEPLPAADDPLGEMRPSIPLPVWLAGGAACLIALVSFAAFRRSRPG
jgi:hypothetical protein